MRSFALPRRAAICWECAALLRRPAWRPIVRTYSDGATTAAAAGDHADGRTTAAPYASEPIIRKLNCPPTTFWEAPIFPVRTRFAPSPTGYLHLGSLRTALYNYLLARRTGGKFIMRIEDTDQTRLVADAEQKVLEDLRWAGISWDEGPDVGGDYGPYRQSERLAIYNKYIDMLLQEGKAYRCFCTPQDLERQKREAHARGENTDYPGTCRHVSPEESQARADSGESFCVRLRAKRAPERPVIFYDLTYQNSVAKTYSGDFVLRKRDGFPSYHFANVVDDKLMGISHVIRGAEWLISTPKHVELYEAFGWTPPVFAHVPLLVNEERQKLSKRSEGVNLTWYQERHTLPSVLVNFAYLLGRGSKRAKKSDVIKLEDMVKDFTPQFTKGDVIVSMSKLTYLRRMYLKEYLTEDPPNMPLLLKYAIEPMEKIVEKYEASRTAALASGNGDGDGNGNGNGDKMPIARIAGPLSSSYCPDGLQETKHKYILKVLRDCKIEAELDDTVRNNTYLFWDIPTAVLRESYSNVRKSYEDGGGYNLAPAEALKLLLDVVREVEWTPEATLKLMPLVTNEKRVHVTFKLLRWALLASRHGPKIPELMMLFGREETLRRIQNAIDVAEELARQPAQHTEGQSGWKGEQRDWKNSDPKARELLEEARRLEAELLK